MSYPVKPFCAGIVCCQRSYKTEPRRRARSGEGPEGGIFTGSTEDSGPMKPGNRVEEKTLTIRKVLGIYLISSLGVPSSSLGHRKPWTRGDSDSVKESN